MNQCQDRPGTHNHAEIVHTHGVNTVSWRGATDWYWGGCVSISAGFIQNLKTDHGISLKEISKVMIKKKRDIIIVIFLSFLVFWMQFGLKILNPSYYLWLMGGDPAQHWLGWSLFRTTPLLQWPLGLNYNYGMDLGNSIVYSDSIPLVAIPLKYILWFYHGDVQYTGFWILICCILNSLSGYLVIRKLTGNSHYAIISSILFAITPAFTARALGHYALASHWILIYSFYLMLEHNPHRYKWIILVVLSVSIHAYLFAMVFPLFLAHLYLQGREIGYRSALLDFFTAILSSGLVMYAVGYFTITSKATEGGYTAFNVDLMSMFVTRTKLDSYILSFMSNTAVSKSVEGFTFLGTGIILLLITNLIFISLNNRARSNTVSLLLSLNPAYVLVISLMMVYAISTHVSFLGHDIFNVNPPKIMRSITTTFRASGRFAWPVMYAIIIFSIALTSKLLQNKSIYAIYVITLITIIDFTPKFIFIHDKYSTGYGESYSYNHVWDHILSRKKIVSTNPSKDNEKWMKFGFMSYKLGSSLGFGYYARTDRNKVDKMKTNAITDLSTSSPRDGYVYLIHKNDFSNEKWEKLSHSGRVLNIDGSVIFY